MADIVQNTENLRSTVKTLSSEYEKLVASLPISQLMELERAQNSVGAQVSGLVNDYEQLNKITETLSRNTKILSKVQSTELFTSYRANLENIRFTNKQLEQHLALLVNKFPSTYKEMGNAIESFTSRHKRFAESIKSGKFDMDVYTQALRDNDSAVVAWEKSLQRSGNSAESTTRKVKSYSAALKDWMLGLGQTIGPLLEVATTGVTAYALLKGKTGAPLVSFGAKAANVAGTMASAGGLMQGTPGGQVFNPAGAGNAATSALASAGWKKLISAPVLQAGALAAIGLAVTYGFKKLVDNYDSAADDALASQGAANAAEVHYNKTKINKARIAKGLDPIRNVGEEDKKQNVYEQGRRNLEGIIEKNEIDLDLQERKLRIMDKMYAPAQARLPLIQKELEIYQAQAKEAERLLSLAEGDEEKKRAEATLLDIQEKRLEKISYIRRSMLEGMTGGLMNIGSGSSTMPAGLSKAQLTMSGYTEGGMQTGKETANTMSYSQQLGMFGLSPAQGREQGQQVVDLLKEIASKVGTIKLETN